MGALRDVESERRKAVCRDCYDRPAGCWKALHYGCARKYREAEQAAAESGACPLDKWRPGAAGLTIVTACYDIGRRAWDGFYRPFFQATLKLKAPLVAYVAPEHEQLVRDARHQLPTAIVAEPLAEIPFYGSRARVAEIQSSAAYRARMAEPDRPECTDALYPPIIWSKFRWLRRAAEDNPFGSRWFFWLDGGFSRFCGDFDKAFPGPRADAFLRAAGDRAVLLKHWRGYAGVDAAAEEYLWDGRSLIQGVMFGGTAAACARLDERAGELWYRMLDKGCVNNEQVGLGHLVAQAPDDFYLVEPTPQYATGLFSRMAAPQLPRVDAPCPLCAMQDPIPDAEVQPPPPGWVQDPLVKARHVAAWQELLSRDFAPPAHLDGDGIVYSFQGDRFWPEVVTAVRLMRGIGITLPIQVWHGSPVGKQLDGLCTLVDARRFAEKHPARKRDHWAAKNWAIAHSGFARALYLDTDAYCVADPAPLFDLLDKHDFLYWANLPWYGTRCDRELMDALAGGRPWVEVLQGGHYLLDCRRAWKALMLATWYNNHADWFWRANADGEGHGNADEDGWRVVLSALRQGEADSRYRCLGAAEWHDVAFVCRWQGRPCIVHRCQSKLAAGQRAVTRGELPREKEVLDLFYGEWPAPIETREERIGNLRRQRQQLLAARR